MKSDVENIIPKTTKQLLLELVKPYRRKTVIFFLLAFLGVLSWTAAPLMVSFIITRLSKIPQLDIYIWLLVAAYVGLKLADEVFWRLGEIVMHSYKPQMIERIRTILFSATLKKTHEYYVNSSSGQISHWINSATVTADEFVDTTIWTVWGSFLGLVLSAIFLLFVHWSLALLFCAWLVLLFTFNVHRGKQFAELVAEQSEEASKASGIVVDSLSNHLSVRVFNARESETNRLVRQQEVLVEKWQKSWWQNIITNIVKGQSAAIVSGLALVLVLLLFVRGVVPIGGIVLFLAYFSGASSSLWQLAWALDNYFRNFGTIQNALDGLQAENERTGKTVSQEKIPPKVSVSLEAVSFAYPDQRAEVILDSINLEIPSGSKVGIVGHSGAGKSTLVGLLLGFYRPDTGKILINGTDIDTKDPSYIRGVSSFVPQDTNLFNRTVRENVAYAQAEATDEQIELALKLSEAKEFVDKLPKGMDTLVGERGVKLSGGQRQRIAIARAILKNTPLLILDEATSSLDSVSEQAIQKSLYQLMKNRTSVVIAHRLSTLKSLDNIVVLDQGRIVEHGKHEELIRQEGIYADLWKRQKDGFIVE